MPLTLSVRDVKKIALQGTFHFVNHLNNEIHNNWYSTNIDETTLSGFCNHCLLILASPNEINSKNNEERNESLIKKIFNTALKVRQNVSKFHVTFSRKTLLIYSYLKKLSCKKSREPYQASLLDTGIRLCNF